MLSLFPELLFLSPLAAFMIRIALALVFGYTAYKRIPQKDTLIRVLGGIDAIVAVALFVGISTQLAALAGAVCTIYWLIKPTVSIWPRSTVALVLVMCLSIIVMGAGPFAFDLPL